MDADRRLSWVRFVSLTIVALLGLGLFAAFTAHPALARGAVPGKVSALPLNVPRPDVGVIPVGKQPSDLALDPNTNQLFVTNYGANSVSVVNTSNHSVAATIGVGSNPVGVAYDSLNHTVFVANEKGASISVIDPVNHTLLRGISTGSQNPFPNYLAYDSGTNEIFASNDQNAVLIVGASNYSFFNYVIVGNISTGVAYDPTHGNIFVTMYDDATVWVISDATDKVTAILHVGNNPGVPTVDTVAGKLFVPNYSSDNVTVFSLATLKVLKNLHESSNPIAAAADPTTGQAVIVNAGSANATVLNEGSYAVTQTVPVGGFPYAAAIDTASGVAYTANFASNNVSYFPVGAAPPPEYSVVFNETGLPGSTPWSVALNGSSQTSSSSSIAFSEPNGGYTYTVGAVSGYSIQPRTGSVQVNGGNVYLSIRFLQLGPSLFTVDFVESGLPSGRTWSVSLNGASLSSATTSIGYQEPNGTYVYHVANLSSYTASPSVGSLVVMGGDRTIDVTYTLNSSLPVNHNVTFSEIGLPAASMWVVHLGQLVKNATTGAIIFQVPNGQYPWYLVTVASYAPSQWSGLVVVNDSDVTVPLTFVEVSLLSFDAGQLPPGTNWSATLSSTTTTIILLGASAAPTSVTKWSEGGTQVTFRVANGTFNYHFSAPGYSATSGQVTVNGPPAGPISVPFTAISASNSPWGSSSVTLYLALGIAVVVIGVVVGLLVMRRRRAQ